jgi:hypothetical protein
MASAVARNAQVAQLVEQGIENPRVGGSIPPLGTTFLMKINDLAICGLLQKLSIPLAYLLPSKTTQ